MKEDEEDEDEDEEEGVDLTSDIEEEEEEPLQSANKRRRPLSRVRHNGVTMTSQSF